MEAIRNTAYAAVASGNDTVTRLRNAVHANLTVAAGPTAGTKPVTTAVCGCRGSQTLTPQTIVSQ
jgi:hypothetical protein